MRLIITGRATTTVCLALLLVGCDSKIADRAYTAAVTGEKKDKAALYAEAADTLTSKSLVICKEGEPTFQPGGVWGATSNCMSAKVYTMFQARGESDAEIEAQISLLVEKGRSEGVRRRDVLGSFNYWKEMAEQRDIAALAEQEKKKASDAISLARESECGLENRKREAFAGWGIFAQTGPCSFAKAAEEAEYQRFVSAGGTVDINSQGRSFGSARRLFHDEGVALDFAAAAATGIDTQTAVDNYWRGKGDSAEAESNARYEAEQKERDAKSKADYEASLKLYGRDSEGNPIDQ